MVTGGGQPGPFGINTAISRLQRAAVRVDHEARPAAGALPDALDPGVHGARTHWIRGFTAFLLAWRTRAVMRMVPG